MVIVRAYKPKYRKIAVIELYFGLRTKKRALEWIKYKGIRTGVAIIDGHNPPWRKTPKIVIYADVTLQNY